MTIYAPIIFNRQKIVQNLARNPEVFEKHDFLFQEMASGLAERLEYINRKFPVALDLGAKTGILSRLLKGRGGINKLIQAELSEKLLHKADGIRVVAEEEFLPFAENSFDLVMSVGSLSVVNDLAGALIQIQRVLKPDGLFLGVLMGGHTLKELRASFASAEIAASGGVSPRISPFIDARDGANLLQRAGFNLPVSDSDIITVEYDHPLKLMRELRGMGAANALQDRIKHFTPCSTMMQAVDNYLRDYSNENGRINASFELVTLTGWKAV